MHIRNPALEQSGLLILSLFLITACGGGGGGGGGGGNNSGGANSGWLIPEGQVVDAGPGRDGIPAIDRPIVIGATTVDDIRPRELVIGIEVNGTRHVYPHNILNWHEVINDSIQFDDYVVSYCPLTGSALGWDVDESLNNTEFGVSGLLYNSNLIMYDRESGSRWSQMLEQSVQGPRRGEFPNRIQIIETTWATWLEMYPDSFALTRTTGFDRDYDSYPYGDYRFSEELLFPVDGLDNRLHPKERVIGVKAGAATKVYQIEQFGPSTQTVNDQFNGNPIVAVGNSSANIAAIYSRELADGTILTFSPLDGQLPNIMEDTEGNVWDIFGNAVSGPRAGEKLQMTNSFTAMWFAWAAFYPGAEIHFN